MSDLQPTDPGARSRWERWNDASLETVGYVFLAIATALALLRPDRAPNDRLITLGIVALAAAWMVVVFTRAPQPRRRRSNRMIVSFVGLLAFATVLMTRNPIFFIFAITGFFHASLLRPWPLTVLGVFVTSVLIEVLLTGFPWPTVDLWVLFGAVILIQTVAIGFGAVLGERMVETNEQRRILLRERDASLREIQGLQQQLVTQAREAGVLDERARMAAEIHDTIAHGLTGIITQLEAAEQAADRGADPAEGDRTAPQPSPDWTRHVDNALRLARDSLTEARRSVAASRPKALESTTLDDALRDVVAGWASLHDVDATFTSTGDVVPLHPDVELALLRTAQEALNNVAKHAGATRVGLTLSYLGDEVALDIRDDGTGFAGHADAPTPDAGRETGAGFGLTAMRQRVRRLAGTLEIESEPAVGTAISARLPAIPPVIAAPAATEAGG